MPKTRTPVVLLLLMIVSKITFPLSSSATFSLHHLFRLTLSSTTTISLVGEVTLDTRRRMRRVRSHTVVVAAELVTLIAFWQVS